MLPTPDLVRVSKLNTRFSSDLQSTLHVHYTSKPGERRVRKEEQWKREKALGRGGSGVVYLEKCVRGDKEGEVRAVKTIQKAGDSYYHRELEAVALFSHAQVSAAIMSTKNDIVLHLTLSSTNGALSSPMDGMTTRTVYISPWSTFHMAIYINASVRPYRSGKRSRLFSKSWRA